MKKTNILLAFTAGLGLFSLFSSCDFELPSSVSVKTDATYNFSIGDIEHDFNDSFDKDTLFAGLETDYNKIYDYFPGKKEEKLQQFLLTLDIPAIHLPIPDTVVPEAGKSLADYLIPSMSVENTVDIDMNMKAIFEAFKVLGDDFAQKVDFYKIPMYVYCNIASGFSSVGMTGRIKIKNKEGGAEKYLIGTADAPRPFVITAAPSLKKEDKTVITDISEQASTVSDETNMTSFMNENKNTESGFTLTYELSFDTEKTKFDGKAINDISLSIYLVLPFKFLVNSSDGSDLVIDLKSLADGNSGTSDDDIFKREKATDTKDFDKYLDAIESIVLGYKTKNNPFVSDSSSLTIESDWPDIKKELEFNGDEVKLTCEELKRMLNKYPYNPSLNLNIADGSSVAIPRDISIKMNVNIALETNGKIEF